MADGLLEVTFLRKKKLGDKTWRFDFTKDFSFVSGQYTTIFLGQDNKDFTIASSPLEKETFSIVTKEGISDFKKNLFSLSLRSKISLKQPAGGFILRENTVPKVFLAGGIGSTPFYSMLCSNKNTKIPLMLLVSFSKKEDVIFYEDLQQIQKENEKIKVVYTVSQGDWEGECGRITEELIRKYVKNLNSMEYMVAGGEQMVEDVEELLLKMKVPPERIRIDIFTGY